MSARKGRGEGEFIIMMMLVGSIIVFLWEDMAPTWAYFESLDDQTFGSVQRCCRRGWVVDRSNCA